MKSQNFNLRNNRNNGAGIHDLIHPLHTWRRKPGKEVIDDRVTIDYTRDVFLRVYPIILSKMENQC